MGLHAIRMSLSDVSGIAKRDIESILRARQSRPFSSLEDFLRRTNVPKPVVWKLIKVGAFDELAPHGRRALLWRLYELERISRGGQRVGRQGRGALEPGGGYKSGELAISHEDPLFELATEGADLPGLDQMSIAEQVQSELEILAIDASAHVLTLFDSACQRLGVIPAVEAAQCAGGEIVTVAGAKVATQTPPLRSGERIIFVTLDDPTGVIDVTVLPRTQNRYAHLALSSPLLAVRGRIRRRGRSPSLVATQLWDLMACQQPESESSP